MILRTLLACILFHSYLFAIAQLGSTNSEYEFDHLVLFVSDSSLENSLTESGFGVAELLSAEHPNQGTRGRYFLFFNTYIELLYLSDKESAKKNEENFKSSYTDRWLKTNSCPFGFGLNLIPFDTASIALSFDTYSSNDAPKGEYYVMMDGNKSSTSPFIYISLPERKYKQFNSLEEIDEKVEDYKREAVKRFLSHQNGVKRLTKIECSIANINNSNCMLLEQLNKVSVKEGKQQLILTFDEGRQGKELIYITEFELTIRY